MKNKAIHSFHIPVLGLSYSIDTPLKVAHYGINSVFTIMDGELIEHNRRIHFTKSGRTYEAIPKTIKDYRAKRICSYINLIQDLVEENCNALKVETLNVGTKIWDYFEMLEQGHALKETFETWKNTEDTQKKNEIEKSLRASIVAGAIEMNIMSKIDNPSFDDEGNALPDEYSDALSALRGFAQSKGEASIVFSAGYNPRLYNYVEQFEDFFPDEQGALKKKIILKVSDYRSALVQGKIFAKKGLWVSEFRIESGLNCGGHAFATDGLLLGPILEEFKQQRNVMSQELWQLCNNALTAKNKTIFKECPQLKISAQGGIGTYAEHQFIQEYYQIDSIGWGSPFLLVPEATNVDPATLNQLVKAVPSDYYLSNASPLGVPFNNFRPSSSEHQRQNRIEKNRPGSPCYKKFLSSNTEFTDTPICTASRQYQNLKIKEIKSKHLSAEETQRQIDRVTDKDCLCEGLAVSSLIIHNEPLPHKLNAVNICPGPNLAFFSGIFSLKEMISHIYGQKSILNKLTRPHVFLNELKLYIQYLKNQMNELGQEISDKQIKYFQKFKSNLELGIEYYKQLPCKELKEKVNLDTLKQYEEELLLVSVTENNNSVLIHKALV